MIWVLLLLAIVNTCAFLLLGRKHNQVVEYRARFRTARSARDHWYQVAHNLNRQRGTAANDRNRAYLQRDNALAKLDAMEADVLATVDDGDIERLRKWAS